MTDLPASLPTQTPRTVPMDAARPTATWIAQQAMALLSAIPGYVQKDRTDMEAELEIAAWTATLADVPQDAIHLAIMDRLKSSDRSRPIVGEIYQAALKHTSFRCNYVAPDDPFGPSDKTDLISADRAAAIAREAKADSPAVVNLIDAIARREAAEREQTKDGAA